MCFSASGSFVASTVLAGIGFVAFSRNESTHHRMFAAIPLLFAAQQAAEGTVWLTMLRPDQVWLQHIAVNVFLGIALVAWPMWMPVSLWRIERDPASRRMLIALSYAGLVVAAAAAVLMLLWKPVAQMAGHSIVYVYSPGSMAISPIVLLAAYALPTVLPFFVSSASLARATGTALVVSLVAAVIIEWDALTSVWCFFAAILSGLVLAAVVLENHLPAATRVRIGVQADSGR